MKKDGRRCKKEGWKTEAGMKKTDAWKSGRRRWKNKESERRCNREWREKHGRRAKKDGKQERKTARRWKHERNVEKDGSKSVGRWKHGRRCLAQETITTTFETYTEG